MDFHTISQQAPMQVNGFQQPQQRQPVQGNQGNQPAPVLSLEERQANFNRLRQQQGMGVLNPGGPPAQQLPAMTAELPLLFGQPGLQQQGMGILAQLPAVSQQNLGFMAQPQAIDPVETMFQQAYVLSGSHPDQAADLAMQLGSQAFDNHNVAQALRACELLVNARSPKAAEVLVKLTSGEPSFVGTHGGARAAEFLLEVSKLLGRSGLPESANLAEACLGQAVKTAVTSGDVDTLLRAATIYAGQQGKFAETRFCLEQGLAIALRASQNPDQAQAMKALEAIEKTLGNWGENAHYAPLLAPYQLKLTEAVGAIVARPQTDQIAAASVELLGRCLVLPGITPSLRETSVSAMEGTVKTLATKHLQANRPDLAIGLLVEYTQALGEIRFSAPDQAGRQAHEAASLIKTALDKINIDSPPSPQVGNMSLPDRQRLYQHGSQTLMEAARLMARADNPQIKQAAVQHLSHALTAAQNLLAQNPAPELHNALADNLMAGFDAALALKNPQLLTQSLNLLSSLAVKSGDRALIEKTAHFFVNTAERMIQLKVPEIATPALKLAGQFANTLGDRDLGLRVASALNSVDPASAAVACQNLATALHDQVKQAIDVGNPDTALEAMAELLKLTHNSLIGSQTLQAVTPQINILLEAALKTKDLATLHETLKLMRLYVAPEEIGKVMAKPLLVLATEAAVAKDYDRHIQLLSLALESSPSAEITLEIANAIGAHSGPSAAEDAYLTADYASLLIDTARKLKTQSPDLFSTNGPTMASALQTLINQTLRPQIDPSRIEELASQANGVFSGSLTNPSNLEYQPQFSSDFDKLTKIDHFVTDKGSTITQAKQHKNITVLHYSSVGGDNLSAEARVSIDKFTELVARKSQIAFEEMKGQKFDKWDISGGHYKQKVLLQADWKKAQQAFTGVVGPNTENQTRGLFYDLQKCRAIEKGTKQKSSAYITGIVNAMDAARDPNPPNAVRIDEFIRLRKEFHLDGRNQKASDTVAQKAFNMLNTVAGYLVEERTYQLVLADYQANANELKPEDRQYILPWLNQKVTWSDQDTTILGGSTRPDFTLKIPDTGKHLLIDFTALDSQGHIFGKEPSWVGSTKVGDAVEVMYPSMSKQELRPIILEGTAVSDEELQKIVAANQQKAQEVNQRFNQEKNLVGFMSKFKAFSALVGSDTNGRHLMKTYGFKVPSPKTAKADVAATALARIQTKALEYKGDKAKMQQELGLTQFQADQFHQELQALV
ncbi:MAG: hypothetical protein ACAI44_31265 [Candidatus Sericytochromatia bacterium]